jgi:glycosyltransferase involved in cell wall biosynthesis
VAYGAINARKGVDSLLRAMCNPSMPANVVVILAGIADEAIHSWLNDASCQELQRTKRLIRIEKFLSCEEEAQVITLADAVWLGYRHHDFMSGVMVLAGQGKKPIVACKNGVIGYMAAKHGLGTSIDVDDPRSVTEAICLLASDVELRTRMGLAGFAIFSGHTDECFSSTIWTNALAVHAGNE